MLWISGTGAGMSQTKCNPQKGFLGEAVFDGTSAVEGVTGRLISDIADAEKIWEAKEIPILVDETGETAKN